MTDRTELIEICKIAQHQGGPQNLSAVGIGRYLRLCSPEMVLALFADIEMLRHGMKGDYDLDAWLDWTKESAALCDKVEHLECMAKNHKIDAGIYRAEAEACAAVLPCSHYMDPPDGGDVSVPEQLRRMAKDAEIGRLVFKFFDRMDDPAECDPLEKSVGEFLAAVSTAMSMEAAP